MAAVYWFKSFKKQAEANHQQKRQGEHFKRRVFMDEPRDFLRKEKHEYHGDDYRRHHYFHMVGEAYSGNDAVERKNGIH